MQKTSNDLIIFLLVSTLLILIMGGFILTILFLYRKKQIAYFKDLEQIRSDYEKNLLKTQLEIQEHTFQSISRDIHDNINLSLTLAKLNLNTIDMEHKKKCADQVDATVNLVSKAIADLTDISRSMNSDIIIEQGLIKALESETNKLKRLNWFEISFEVHGNPVFLDSQKELFMFRIVQEAFNNILKHAQSRHVLLQLDYKNEQVDIMVKDDGVGFDHSGAHKISSTSAGLKNMQKRAGIINGNLQIESCPGRGTMIRIEIPFNS